MLSKLYLLIILSSISSYLLAIHVAFIIAGSPRSFIFPAVHESIRVNLISAFCPIDTCSADVFVRVSLSDNTHTVDGEAVANSKGVVIPADERERPLVRHALHRLHLAVRGAMNATWVDVGSVAEREEMKAHFNSSRHRIFRELDPRRYSMYFGRWSAYQQARSYEREHGLRYAWFVHTRFDMAFGAPIQPYFKLPSTKLWVHDTWASDVPDIFALIPAALADAYYSMDLLVQDKAMCLGGPNFNKASVEDSTLVAMGFNAHEIYIAKKVRCRVSGDGWSERILKRKLILAKISLKLNNIGFTPIFSFVLRVNLIDYCQYLHPMHIIGWIRKSHRTNGAMYSGCLSFIHEIRREAVSPKCPPLPLMSDEEFGGDGCLLGRNVSGWNYMPYRIRLPPRQGGHCLTASGDNVTLTYTLSFAPCISLDVSEEAMHTYSISQLFRFHVGNTHSQQIGYLDYKFKDTDAWLCLTNYVQGHPLIDKLGQNKYLNFPFIRPCKDANRRQLFTIQVKGVRKRPNKRKRNTGRPPIKLITIANDDVCLSYSSNVSAALSWRSCQREGRNNSTFRQIFLAERTFIADV